MTRSISVGDGGLHLPGRLDASLDILFDGQRVWSFRPTPGQCDVAWPKALRPHLSGQTDVEVVDHLSGAVLYAGTVRFGGSTVPLTVVDAAGHPLTVDKSGRLQRDFSRTDQAGRTELMDALERVLADLRDVCGLDAYLMYGCLLGAVRDGRLIGHDSDADVAYLSRWTHPFDVVRECNQVLRTMRGRGWRVVRMSGANFKVWHPLPDGRRVGIDVFGSFHVDGRFHVTGSLTGTLDRSAILPLGTVVLEGRELPAPHRPEEVLEFTYGPGWRVPDPAFDFGHDPVDVRRMDGWLRGYRRRLRHWHDFYTGPDARRVPAGPSTFAHWVADRLAQEPGTGHEPVLDLGAGTGRDAGFFARQGRPVVAYDYAMPGLRRAGKGWQDEGLDVTVRYLNLEDVRGVLVTAARLAHRPEVRHVYARGLLDALCPSGRENLWRFASMVQRRGGLTFVEFRTPPGPAAGFHFGAHVRTFVDPDEAVREIEARGGTVLHRETGTDLAPLGEENPHICRLVVRWTP